MDQEAINRDLRERDSTQSRFQSKLLQEVDSYIKASSDKMSSYWPVWEKNEYLYRGYRFKDDEDRDADKKAEPVKIIVPMVYAQLQTFISFVLSTFTQRDYFYELRGVGPEDQRYKDGIEMDLQHQVDKQQFILKLYNWILQAGKYGFGVTKCQWTTEHETVRVRQDVAPSILSRDFFESRVLRRPIQQKHIYTTQDLISYEGNQVTNISPYCFFPDPELPLARFQEGAFVGHEEVVSRITVRNKEGTLYHGTDKIPNGSNRDPLQGKPTRRTRIDKSVSPLGNSKSDAAEPVTETEILVRIIPDDWKKKNGVDIDIGSGRTPVTYVVTIINDEKIVRFEPYGYLHNKFGYSILEYSPDADSFLNPGLTDTIFELQNLMTWFLNSHVVNVRKAIKNRFIGNPEKVFTEDIESGSSIIRTKGTGDVDRSVKQLAVTDVTMNHVRDMESLNKLIQFVTGINDNAIGQYAPGRRSAYESRQVNAGAAARLKMHAQMMYQQGIEPLGRLMLANTRQGRTEEIYNMIVGERAAECPFDKTIIASSDRVIGGYDFVPYDATLPSDRISQANVFKELLTVLVASPESMMVFNKNPEAILDHIMNLLGIRNVKDFNLVSQQVAQGVETQVAGQGEIDQMLNSGQVEPTNLLDALGSA